MCWQTTAAAYGVRVREDTTVEGAPEPADTDPTYCGKPVDHPGRTESLQTALAVQHRRMETR